MISYYPSRYLPSGWSALTEPRPSGPKTHPDGKLGRLRGVPALGCRPTERERTAHGEEQGTAEPSEAPRRHRLLRCSAGTAPDLDAPGRVHRGGGPLDGDLQQTSLELGAYVALVYARGQRDAPPESAVVALPNVETHLFLVHLAPAFPGDGQHIAGEGDLQVLRVHAREREPDKEVGSPGEDVDGGDPGGRVVPRPVLLPGLGADPPRPKLPHPVPLAYGVYDAVKRISPLIIHAPSFLPLWAGAPDPGILPEPGNEDRLVPVRATSLGAQHPPRRSGLFARCGMVRVLRVLEGLRPSSAGRPDPLAPGAVAVPWAPAYPS